MKVPSPGESITEVEIAEWMVEDGDYVEKDQTIASMTILTINVTNYIISYNYPRTRESIHYKFTVIFLGNKLVTKIKIIIKVLEFINT